jgi:DNA end-binding protein Ku
MPRSMWKGAVSFGMVAIPVRLYLATESKSVSFRSLCPHCRQPIKQQRHCPVDDHVVEYRETLRGFEIDKDQFVVIEEVDLDSLPLPSAHTIDIQEFVDGADIPAELYMKQAYYLEPEKVGVKPYYLLKEALADMGKVAVGKIALRDREHMATLRPHGRGMVVNSLHWPDEIRSMDDLNLPEDEVKIDKREMAMARMLIENLTEEFDPDRYHDQYREALLAVARAKAEGHQIETVEAPAPRVMDLMAALKASVEASKRGRAEASADDEEEAAPVPAPRLAGVGGSRRKGDPEGADARGATAEAEEKPRRRVARAS